MSIKSTKKTKFKLDIILLIIILFIYLFLDINYIEQIMGYKNDFLNVYSRFSKIVLLLKCNDNKMCCLFDIYIAVLLSLK